MEIEIKMPNGEIKKLNLSANGAMQKEYLREMKRINKLQETDAMEAVVQLVEERDKFASRISGLTIEQIDALDVKEKDKLIKAVDTLLTPFSSATEVREEIKK